MKEIIIHDPDFDLMIDYVYDVRFTPITNEYYISFYLPPLFFVDIQKVALYFKEDAVLKYEDGHYRIFAGTIKDPVAGKYIMDYLRDKELVVSSKCVIPLGKSPSDILGLRGPQTERPSDS